MKITHKVIGICCAAVFCAGMFSACDGGSTPPISGGESTPSISDGDDGNYRKVVLEHDVVGAGGYGALFDACIDPFQPETIATRCDMGGIYMSYDAGASWTRHNIDGTVLSLMFDPSTEGVVWAAGSGVYRSDDHGKTFNMVYPNPDDVYSAEHNYENSNRWIFAENCDYEPSYQVWSMAVNRNSGGKNVYAAQRINAIDKTKRKIIIHSTEDGQNFHKFAEIEYSYNFKLDFDETNDCLIVATPQKIIELNREGEEVFSTEQPVFVHHTSGNTMAFASSFDPVTKTNEFVFSVNAEGEHVKTACYMTENLRDPATYRNLVTGLANMPLRDLIADPTADEQEMKSYQYYEWLNGKKVMHEFDWTIANVTVLDRDTVYLYHEQEIPLQNGSTRRVLAYLKYDGHFRWLFGFPHKAVNLEENPTWQDGDSGCCFGFSSSPQNKNSLAFATIIGVFYTPDGEKFYQRHSNLCDPVTLTAVSGDGKKDEITVKPCTTTGLDVQCTYETVTDPFDPKHLLMACTDFGLLQSFDGGESWTRSLRSWNGDKTAYMSGDFRNTCYDLEFDPERKGVVYALWSGRHNMPYSPVQSYMTGKGAFGISYDGGTSWTLRPIRENNVGIPYRMDVVYGKNERTFYVATEGYGFYVSHDTGRTFTEMNEGITPSYCLGKDKPAIFGNEIIEADGEIYAITSAGASTRKQDKTYERAFYHWNENKDAFEEIPLPANIACVRDIVYSENEDCVYLAAICHMVNNYTKMQKAGGGVWKYKDGTFSQVFDETKSVWGVELDSKGTLYATLFHGGIYYFTENNTKAHLLCDDLFHTLKTLQFGATDDIIYVATFGGGTERLILGRVRNS